jgi:hypothetical protein
LRSVIHLYLKEREVGEIIDVSLDNPFKISIRKPCVFEFDREIANANVLGGKISEEQDQVMPQLSPLTPPTVLQEPQKLVRAMFVDVCKSLEWADTNLWQKANLLTYSNVSAEPFFPC